MVEEEVNAEVLPTDFERVLASDEREADSQLQEELSNVFEEPGFEVPLVSFLGKCQEIKIVRVLQELLGQVRLGGRKRLLEVGQRLSLPAKEPAFDLHHKDVPAPLP